MRWACATCCSSPAIRDAWATIPDATAVFDVDSIGLTNLVSRLNQGCDVGGQPIGAPTRFHIGVSVNPSAPNLDDELRRFDYKVEAGAEFVVTRPVFDSRRSIDFSSGSSHGRLPVVAGVLPFESARERRVHGQRSAGRPVPEALLERMRASRRARQPRPKAWPLHVKLP